MARIIKNCEICGKALEQTSRLALSENTAYVFYKCGHVFFEETTHTSLNFNDWTSVSGEKQVFDFQKEGIEWLAENNFNGIIGDPMGLGKTIQALKAIQAFEKTKGHFPTTLIVVKSATIYQWAREAREWISPALDLVWIIRNGKDWIPPGFKIYIISMDTLSKFCYETSEKPKQKTLYSTTSKSQFQISPTLKALGIEFLIVDECHSFKNPDSKRSAALVNLIALLNIPQKIFLSGTLIMNRAEEFFVPLNLFKPTVFRSLQQFRNDWLRLDSRGRFSRIENHLLESFKRELKDIYLRREKSILNLPPFRRAFETIHIEDSTWIQAYNNAIEELQADIGDRTDFSYQEVHVHLMTLRRIVGMAKIDFAVEYIDTFLDTEPPEEKIAIGIHHESVRDVLYARLKQRGIGVLKLSGEDSALEKEQIKQRFERPENRILIVNMLAGGTGLNLQMCSNVLILERQWNAAIEEQFEGRFWRQGQTKPVLAEYFVAEGIPVDEMFHNMVEEKRRICTDHLEFNVADEPDAFRSIVSETLRVGKIK